MISKLNKNSQVVTRFQARFIQFLRNNNFSYAIISREFNKRYLLKVPFMSSQSLDQKHRSRLHGISLCKEAMLYLNIIGLKIK